MNGVTPSVLALRPGAKLSKADRQTLRDVGIVVVNVSPDDLVAVQAVSILPANEMLRCALECINSAPVGGYTKELRAHFAKLVIDTYLKYGEAKSE